MSLPKIIGTIITLIVAIPTIITIIITWYIEGAISGSLLQAFGVHTLIIGIISIISFYVLITKILDLI